MTTTVTAREKSTPSLTTTPVAVLLLAYGGPLSLDDVEPYLLDVRGGRPTPPELVAEVRERYALIGGRSPLLDHTQAQARALERWLHRHAGPHFRTFVAMRHWHPYIRDVVPTIVAQGYQRLIAIPMAPHYSRMSVGAYRRALDQALERVAEPVEVQFVERWGDHPGFIAVVAAKVQEALQRFPTAVRPNVEVIFTAHSLPRKVVERGDPYHEELTTSAALVAQRVGLSRWHFAYQSAGASNVPWLGPDVSEVVSDLAARGARHVLVVPIGFVCDHVEILYDIDIELRQHAERLGVHLERTASLNDDPAFIETLGQLVLAHNRFTS